MSIIKNSKLVLVLALGMIFNSLFFSIIPLNSKSISKTQEVMTPKNSYKSSWVPNGTAICTNLGDQFFPQICSDGTGGAIITWEDRRNGTADIYAQKINSLGALQWTLNRTIICTAAEYQFFPQICSDGTGGAIITWEDHRGLLSDIYGQRINSSGIIQWTPNGTAIYTDAYAQFASQICSDGAGGAIITWLDRRNGVNYDIYAQKVRANGIFEWSANGKAICTEVGDQWYPQICSDGAGGAIITWHDNRSGSMDIYIQRINSSGIIQWKPNGIALSTVINNQLNPQICSDGAGGAIITWQDRRNGVNYDIFAQKVDVNGNIQWTTDGTAICTIVRDQVSPQLCSDGTGGAIITWEDARIGTGSFYNIYAQRINYNGELRWTINGVPICTDPDGQYKPQICSDGTGGAIITWTYMRNQPNLQDIYVQRINAKGNIQSTINGIPICTADENQDYPQICSDGAGGAIITWRDERNGADYDIYAQRVEMVQLLNVEIANISFSSGKFDIIIFVYYNDEIAVDSATINAWWNGIDVSVNTQNRGGGFYLISLDSIYVALGENPILLNMTISADGFEDKHFKTYLAVTKERALAIPGYNNILIIGLISVMIVAIRKLFFNKK